MFLFQFKYTRSLLKNPLLDEHRANLRKSIWTASELTRKKDGQVYGQGIFFSTPASSIHLQSRKSVFSKQLKRTKW